MSKFISSAVNYSETNILKTKILSIILESYNEKILLNDSVKLNLDNTTAKYIIPNNNKKYYMLIVNKSDITKNNINNQYKILYFFPYNNDNPNDFYVEIDSNKTNFTKNNYLFEGYMYVADGQNTFLISDILAIDSIIVNCDYSLRYSLLNKIIRDKKNYLNNLNGHLNINIHSMFEINNEDDRANELFNIFKNNFIFKNDINSIEYIDEKSLIKTQNIIFDEKSSTTQDKIISKTKYIDVYNVYNVNTNDFEGILYIKTIKDSKKLYELTLENSQIILQCLYNHTFKKWQIIN